MCVCFFLSHPISTELKLVLVYLLFVCVYIYMYIARCNAILMALHPIGAQDKIVEIKILSKKWTDFLGIFQRD